MIKLRIGAIGLGVISRFYLAAIDALTSVELAAVCDVREAALEPFTGTVKTYRDHRELLARADVDAVIISVPNDAHAQVCRDSLLAGVGACVEKPLAIRLADAHELAQLADDRGVALFTAFHRRYNENIIALRRRLPEATAVTSMTVRYLERIEEHVGADGWYLDLERCGGGCVADNGPNAFDLVRYFLGDVSVSEVEIHRDSRGLDRQAVIVLATACGASALVELDWSYPGERKDVDIMLADGTAHHAGMLLGYPEFKGSLWHEYIGILKDFEEAVRTGGNVSRDGVAAVEIVDRVYAAERVGPDTAVASL